MTIRTRIKIGDMLIDAGLISKEALSECLEEQKQTSMKLGEFLIAKGVVKESELIDALSKQLRVHKYLPDNYPIDVGLASLLPSEMAVKYKVVPLMKEGDSLHLAMVDPMDINAIDVIEEITQSAIIPVISSAKEQEQLTGSIYGIASELGTAINNIEELHEEDLANQVEKVEDLQISSLQDMAEGAPIIRMVNWIISEGVRQEASDIHISPEKSYVQLRFRIDGKLQEVPAPPKSMFLAIASRIKILSNMDIAISMIPQDGRFSVRVGDREVNIRASTIPTTNGENIVLRLLDTATGTYTLDSLGMTEYDRALIEAVINKPYGMILSTGPTGSGKSTSLYAILKRILCPELNIITVEDPVEYRVEKIRQVQLNHKAGMTFASALRHILRQDPDVIMVGEIRDTETATIACRAALTGHRVLSTVHTNDAAGAISRLIDMGIPPFILSSTLIASFAQRLVRKVCPHCKEYWEPSAELIKTWNLENHENVKFARGKGCLHCMHTGYKGRTAIFEVLPIDSMVREMITQNKTAGEIIEAVRLQGIMRTLKQDAAIKLINGITSLEEATSAVMV